jgi:broad specificity phosphatase PhoE
VAVYTSPLGRAVQTAEAIARVQRLEALALPALLDLDFGEWHGLSFTEAQKRYPSLHRAWNEQPHTVTFPGGESLSDVRRRASQGICEITSRHGQQTVTLVGHAVVNRVILCTVLGVSLGVFWRFSQDTCAVNVFTVSTGGDMVLHLMNDTSHLDGSRAAVADMGRSPLSVGRASGASTE